MNKWKELLAGACLYVLVIFAGYWAPFFVHLLKAHCQTLIALGMDESTAWRHAIAVLNSIRL